MQNLQKSKETAKKQRENYLDWISGLMILQMIFGHILIFAELIDKPGWFEANHILSFFMPWFFFKSGMFFNSAKSWAETLKSSWKRLMVPFIIFTIIGYFVQVLWLCLLKPEVNWKWYIGSIKQVFTDGCIATNGPIWYLLSLFIIRLGYFQLSKVGVKDSLLLLLSAVISISFYLYGLSQILLIVVHTVLGKFFFVCGHYFKIIQFNNKVFFISLTVTISTVLLHPSHVEMYGGTLEYGNYTLYFAYSLAAVIVINNLIQIIPPRMLLKVNLSSIGRNSMSYLVVHFPILALCQLFFSFNPNFSSTYKFLIILIVLTITLPPLKRLLNKEQFKWMVGE